MHGEWDRDLGLRVEPNPDADLVAERHGGFRWNQEHLHAGLRLRRVEQRLAEQGHLDIVGQAGIRCKGLPWLGVGRG